MKLCCFNLRVITSVNSVVINRNQKHKLGSVISCDVNPHMDKSIVCSLYLFWSNRLLQSTARANPHCAKQMANIYTVSSKLRGYPCYPITVENYSKPSFSFPPNVRVLLERSWPRCRWYHKSNWAHMPPADKDRGCVPNDSLIHSLTHSLLPV